MGTKTGRATSTRFLETPPDLEEEAKALHQSLKAGKASAYKFGKRGQPHWRTFTLTPDLHITWETKNPFKPKHATVVNLSRVTRVQSGQNTVQFSRHGKKYQNMEARSMSLVYDESLSSLDLVLATVEEQKVWVNLFQRLVAHVQKTAPEEESQDLKFLRMQWKIADKDNSDTLDESEIIQLVQKLNLTLEKKYIKVMLKKVDDNSDGVLQFEEFIHLMELLRARPELEGLYYTLLQDGVGGVKHGKVMHKLSKEQLAAVHKGVLPVPTFLKFLQQIQGERIGESEVTDLLRQLDPDGDESFVRYTAFMKYLSSPHNDCFDTVKEADVYQDMTKPLSHYFIASSHNTYLEGDQLKSNSSVNRYINDLCKGCRCVELDCWDGDAGDPIIFHGHTLTGKIVFKNVIEAVREYSFFKSEYPVILSLENHCSLKQQEKMADYLITILGDLLVRPEVVDGVLPSPEELRNKIIIKGKISKEQTASEEDDWEDDDEEDDEDSSPTGTGLSGDFSPVEMSGSGTLNLNTRSSSRKGKKEEKKEEKKKEHHTTAPALSRITFLGGTKFKGWEKAKMCDANQMSSFGEKKTGALIAKSPAEWVEYNKRMMSRIYPAGSRVDSSNYDPMPSWTVGNQIVALNYQTAGGPLRLNDGKFRDNGGCGYLLKPAELVEPGVVFHPETGPFKPEAAITLTVQVISAQQLPKPGGIHRGEIIDPYVSLSISGVPIDTTKKTKQTAVIGDNGFNPMWNETFTFDITMPELALLTLNVMDKDMDADDFIAYATIPLPALRSGYRSVKLFSSNSTRHGEFEHCSLFCYFDIQSTYGKT